MQIRTDSDLLNQLKSDQIKIILCLITTQMIYIILFLSYLLIENAIEKQGFSFLARD
jgi:hypothetical protein